MAQSKLTKLPRTKVTAFAALKRLFKKPFPAQRSHRLHLSQTPFLKTGETLYGDMCVFHAVRYRENGKLKTYLVDGYTRIEAVIQGKMKAPAEVLVLTHVVADYEAAYALYCQYNHSQTIKRSKHHVQSGVREATIGSGNPRDSFTSSLLVAGALVTGLHFSGIPGSDLRAKASAGFTALDMLDKMKLNKTRETGGVLAAYMAILFRDHGQADRVEIAQNFIRGINQDEEFEASTAYEQNIIEARNLVDDRRAERSTMGLKNVQEIRDYVLSRYQAYLVAALRKPGKGKFVNMTLGQFLEAA